MNQTQLVLLINYLRDLADGAGPHDAVDGICYSVYMEFGIGAERFFTRDVLGNCDWPLGVDEYLADGSLWEGERGEHRRTLAGILASFIETEFLLA